MKQQPLRVAMIIQSYLPRLGGAERQLAALAPLLRMQDVELHVLTRRYPGMAPRASVDGIPVLRTPAFGGKVLASLLYTAMTLFHLRRLQPDVIHAHELLSPATTGVLAKRLWGTPLVAKVLRGGHLGDIAKLRSRPGGQRRLAALRANVAAFITISEEIDRELAEAGIPAGRRVFIPNGVDTAKFAPTTPAEKQQARAALSLPEAPVALYSGRLASEKQVDVLLSVWPAVRAAHPEATLLVLGDGSEAARLRRLASPGVRFIGRVDDVTPFLRAADLFVLPSATEGLSNALLEAMAAGLPPIATAVGGAPDLIDGDANGLLVPPGDAGALEHALLSLAGDRARQRSLGRQARARIVTTYSLANVAARLRALYERVLAEATPQFSSEANDDA